MATAPKSPADNLATSRTVVLLRASDRKKLKHLADREKVSAGEIIRRSLDSYETLEARIHKEEARVRAEAEEKMLESGLSILQDALQAVNESMSHTNAKLDKLHLELKALDPR